MKIYIPDKRELLRGSFEVSVSPKYTSWTQACIGSLTSEKGVYVIHYQKSIKYVGKTNGKSMSFSKRLRRHFQETASGNKHIYPRLVELKCPPSIKVKIFTLDEIKKYIKHNVTNVNELNLIPLFEAALIVALKPEYQM